ncbi:flagellin [Haloferax mediterranei ATCC 33500]|nr:archaellin/type IV pilin N-terminal domain-containing protein [Haloferax mediterranei]AFK18933.1 flagellin B3 [Haloferax mediterranei ATCC 33500]AHZ21704.1 flagellin [Haloferax mediterranei ATCC 33500]MDX5989026.1 archaellin/type IV pilin N-terminal domain-containing protein [Haloferax mediterranei ATCC 33500]QCQ75419.1 flagellin [Haloferax mediterranei ATCC 33500]
MFNKFNSEDRGQVGIGTLIVFIAMVLVAAIAAGVLVNTAGFLQATAEDAGQESVNKVTNRVEVLNTHGTVGAESDIDNITMTVRLAAGSSSVDLNETSIKYLSDTKVATLTNSSKSLKWANESKFNLTTVTDDDGSFGVLNSMNDRYEVRINTSDIEDPANTPLGGGLSTGEKVTLEITSRTGGTTQVILTMPQQLAGKTQGEPVEL